ncbi:hypothetical protein [Prevotellamassilia timonensis]|uniref:hypothetical protein n=1 Tax=Prevotellamassilia timonensis TaxID=1852370 RepID=UPI001F2C17F8|nr:hypothetical protein [Prevotellamassilia timonensis]
MDASGISHFSHIDCNQKLFDDKIETSKLAGFLIAQVEGNIKKEEINLLGLSNFVPTLSFIEELPVPRGLISYLPLMSSKRIPISFPFAFLYTILNIPTHPSKIVGDESFPLSLENIPPKNDCPPPLFAL